MPRRRVLLVRAGALGDVLLLRPAMAAVQRAGMTVGVLAPSGPASAVTGPGPGDVEEALPWEAAAFAGLLHDDGVRGGAAADALRRYDFAIAYTRNAALTRGLGRAIPTVVQHDPAPPPDGPHASAWLATPLAALGIPTEGTPFPVLVPGAQDHERAAAVASGLPGRFLAIHPGSGSPAKNWPADRFADLIRALGRGPWLLVRGPADDDAAAILQTIPGAQVARDLPLRVLAALLASAGVYVGNDSGVTHLAAATGAPTVALFGPTDPRLWGPIGPRVTVLRSGASPEAITVESVIAAVEAARR